MKRDMKKTTYVEPIILSAEEFIQQQKSFGASPSEKSLHSGEAGGSRNYHHPTCFMGGESGKEVPLHVRFEMLYYSNIVCLIDEKSGKKSYYLYGDIYGKWPLGKERGQDPYGDVTIDLLEALQDRYAQSMDQDECKDVKKTIFVGSKQGVPPGSTPTKSRLKSIINYPTFDAGHAKAGEPDTSKSPTFALKIWDKEYVPIVAQQQYQQIGQTVYAVPPRDSLIIDNGTKQVFTKVYDKTVNTWNQEKITSEKDFAEFVYTKGDARLNDKPPFRLRAEVTILSPSYYWQAEKLGSAQLKIVQLDIIRKLPVDRKPLLTPEQQEQQFQRFRKAEMFYNDREIDPQQQQQEQQLQIEGTETEGTPVYEEGNVSTSSPSDNRNITNDPQSGLTDPNNNEYTDEHQYQQEGYDQINDKRAPKKLKFTPMQHSQYGS